MCVKNTWHLNIRSTLLAIFFLTAEQSKVQRASWFCSCPKLTHKFGKEKVLGFESLSRSLSVTTHHLCLSHKPPRAHGFVYLIWMQVLTHAHFLGRRHLAFFHSLGKTVLRFVPEEAFGQWQMSLRLDMSLYWRRAPQVTLHFTLWRILLSW